MIYGNVGGARTTVETHWCRSRNSCAVLATVLLLAVQLPVDAAEDPACDPDVRQLLEDHAVRGIERNVALVRHPEMGVREPLSILDVSCVSDMFSYRSYDVFFDPGRSWTDILGLLQRKICSAARDAHHNAINRSLDRSVFDLTRSVTRESTRLPGLTKPADTDAETQFRMVVQGEDS